MRQNHEEVNIEGLTSDEWIRLRRAVEAREAEGIARAIDEAEERDLESRIQDGSKVSFPDHPGEVFTVSQWDGSRGWAGDEQGRGWYFRAGQVELVEEA